MVGTFVFLFFLFLTLAGYLLITRKSEVRSARLQQRVAEALQASPAEVDYGVRLARQETLSGIPFIERLLASFNFAKKLDRIISQADIQITVGRLLMFSTLAGLLAMLAAFTILNSIVAIVLLGLMASAAPVMHVVWVRKKRINKFMEYLPDALDLMGRSLAVGHAFSESLHQVADEMPDPIATEFRITYEEQNLGLPLKLALENLAERIPSLDLRLCITAVLIQRETGGNLAEILEKVSLTIRERFKMMEEFRTMTTSSRASAWILCLMPFAIVLLMTALSPKYMSVLIHDTRGHYIIATAIGMQIVGMLFIRKILAIKI
ncbi:MAG: type II secretion system F family protein [Acidobacteriota bacterium]|nr:type II secretion system F family protein [Acidobacteriota bacterium]